MARRLGLDLGGTNIKVAVLDGHDVVGRASVATQAAEGPDAVVGRLVAAAHEAIERWGPVEAVGLGVPGLFDEDTGRILLFPNLPGDWPGQPVVDVLRGELGRPVRIVNDARAFTLAEARLGAGAGYPTVVGLVLGTGIGGGLVIGGRLHAGRHTRAGEIAHQVVLVDGPPCGCGNRGCLEAVASSAALARLAGAADAEAAFAAARAGDERAAAAIETVAGHLGLVIANMITVLVSERVVIGGGVAAAAADLLDPVRAAVRRHCVLVAPDAYEIVPAVLGPDAGAVGAALWADQGDAPLTGG